MSPCHALLVTLKTTVCFLFASRRTVKDTLQKQPFSVFTTDHWSRTIGSKTELIWFRSRASLANELDMQIGADIIIQPHPSAICAYCLTLNCQCQTTSQRLPAAVSSNFVVCDKSESYLFPKTRCSCRYVRSCSRDSSTATPFWQIFHYLLSSGAASDTQRRCTTCGRSGTV